MFCVLRDIGTVHTLTYRNHSDYETTSFQEPFFFSLSHTHARAHAQARTHARTHTLSSFVKQQARKL